MRFYMGPKSNLNTRDIAASTSSAAAAANVLHPNVITAAVTDPAVLDQARLFSEAVRQAEPLAEQGTACAAMVRKAVRDGTALKHGLKPETLEKYATSPNGLNNFVKGANPTGKAAEIVAVSDYRALHSGQEAGIMNPPERVARNVSDIRISTDSSSRKDLMFFFEGKDGKLIPKYNGQVKSGNARYVADELVKMAKTPGYGKTGYVDSRFVNKDGSPRVAPDAFSEGQARALQKAKVRLRGIKDLEKRAELLNDNIRAHSVDGLDPVARQQLQQLRDDIAKAYTLRRIAGRIGGAAAIAAASAAVVSLVVQLATDGEVDVIELLKASGTGAAFGAVGAAFDGAVYHVATKVVGMTPEAAKTVAQQSVGVAFCLVAVGIDLMSEIRAAREHELSIANSISGTSLKIALDLLPILVAPLGLAGVPILVATQMGGRWLISKVRLEDALIEEAIEADEVLAANLRNRAYYISETARQISLECEITDEIYKDAMKQTKIARYPNLRLITKTRMPEQEKEGEQG